MIRSNWYGDESVPTVEEHREMFPEPPGSRAGGEGEPWLWHGTPEFAARLDARAAILRGIQPATVTQVAPLWGIPRQAAQTAMATMEKRGLVRRAGTVAVGGLNVTLWVAV